MSEPTLLIKGSLRAPNDDPALQRRMDEYVPIDYIKEWINARATKTGPANRVLVLKAETASGKSSALIAELYREFVVKAGGAVAGSKAPGIICTQPRTLTAIRNILQLVNVSDYGSFLKIGETVGWSTRFNKLRARRYGLLSATVGTLTQQLKVWTDEQVMAAYKFILIDETHERDLETDMTLYMLKNFLQRNATDPSCPFVILMSATFEPQQFLRYYGVDAVDNFIWCEGRAFGIVEHWEWNENRSINDYPRTAAGVVGRIVRNEDNNEPDEDDKCDILIFMPGAAEINATAKRLDQINAELVEAGYKPVSILKIDSPAQRDENISFRLLDIPLEEHRVFVPGHRDKLIPGRRVVIATNIAETGITIPSLKYVIDSGYNKEVEFNPNHGISSLIVRPAPQSRIKQRMGRAGRKFKGHFYPLYPKYLHGLLPVNQLPTVMLGDTSLIIQSIIIEQLRAKMGSGSSDGSVSATPTFSIADIDMVDVPSADALWAALEKLYALGFIAPRSIPFPFEKTDDIKKAADSIANLIDSDYKDGFGLTKLGMLADNFRMIPPESIRMILAGYVWGASILDLITIAAYLIVGPSRFEGAAAGPAIFDDGSATAIDGGGSSNSINNDGINGDIGRDDNVLHEAVYTGAAAATAYFRGRRTGVADTSSAAARASRHAGLDWTKLYALGEPGFLGGRGQLYRTRMLIGDEFIDGVFILGAAKRRLAAVSNTDMLVQLREWADEYRVNWYALMEFFATRDEIIEQMLMANFDIFCNESAALVDSHPSNFIDTITRLKHCIYDGYRCNILRLGEDGVYRSGGVGQDIDVGKTGSFAGVESFAETDSYDGADDNSDEDASNTSPQFDITREVEARQDAKVGNSANNHSTIGGAWARRPAQRAAKVGGKQARSQPSKSKIAASTSKSADHAHISVPAVGREFVGGIEVVTPKLFKKDEISATAETEFKWSLSVKPRILLHSGLTVKQASTGHYEVIAGAVSTMDGFVNIDDTYLG